MLLLPGLLTLLMISLVDSCGLPRESTQTYKDVGVGIRLPRHGLPGLGVLRDSRSAGEGFQG